MGLYDYTVDPDEETNLASVNQYREVKEGLKNKLIEGLGLDEDQGMLGAWVSGQTRSFGSAFIPKPTCRELLCLNLPGDWSIKCTWPECSLHVECAERNETIKECPFTLSNGRPTRPTPEYNEAVHQYSLKVDSDPWNNADW